MAADGGSAAAPAQPEPPASLPVRLLRMLEALAGAHVELARDEAARDARRIASGLILLGVAALLLTTALALGHAAAVWLVADATGWRWPEALGVVAGGDVLAALLLLLVGRSRLTKPVLRRTRELARKTASALAG